MRSYLERLANLRIGWNRRQLGEEDFYRLCRRFRITVVEMPLTTNGFYYCVKGRHFIAVSSRLSRLQKLLVMFHEFAHFLMHSPDTNTTASFHGLGKKTRKEQEADAFALCALIPKPWMESREVSDLIEEGFSAEILKERAQIYERLGL
ncbi:MAG TPA: ImmA/IrrE family metallo-endopeptidase [Pyrinomonadaceae bacterium]|jgi:Zn-dependent peptidase ImmA (M78 family)|nr:ImmA/IrrE family metallo-endopeptidase [Pyrinomonadaceae bacterium]